MLAFLVITGAFLIISETFTRFCNAGKIREAIKQAKKLGGDRIPILMPVFGRPHYLRQVLTALSRAEDIDRTILVISQDGSNSEVAEIISNIEFAKVIVIKHIRPFLGVFCYFWDSEHAVTNNIRFLLNFAFERLGAKYAIVLEDDLVPSPDFVRYFAWANHYLLSDSKVMSVTGFNIHSRLNPGVGYDPSECPYDIVVNRENGKDKFTGWSWAITSATWQTINKEWSLRNWDIELDKTQRKLGLISYKPVLGRVRNIGMQGGINFTESDQNPKWTEVIISENVPEYNSSPRILSTDPVIPPSRNMAPAERILNEKDRKRGRRLWLGALVLAATILEIILVKRYMAW